MVSFSTRLPVTQERDSSFVSTFSTLVLPTFLSYFAMGVLVQRKRTAMIRFALLPVTLLCAYRVGSSLDLSFGIPNYRTFNQCLVVGMFVFAMRSTTWAFAKKPYKRIALQPKKIFNGDTMSGGTNNQSTNDDDDDGTLFTAIWNAWDLLFNLRGIGWDWSEGLRIPKSSLGTKSTLEFLLITLAKLVFYVLATDVTSGAARYFSPGTAGSTEGGTIFDASLTPLSRYTRSSIVTILVGSTIYLTAELIYHINTIQSILLFRQTPSQWPPLFDNPLISTSLTSLWGRRWHQLIRQCFISLGARPLSYLLGRTGGVMGAFVISGVMHYVGLKAMKRGIHPVATFGFFSMQGVGVILEGMWKRRTGLRVDGFSGLLWTWVWAVFWANFMVDECARAGLVGFVLFPDDYRPIVLLVHFLKYLFRAV
ncbi:membrane bound O-acyl transferase family-domain-containing protein [Suillus bovinus]|uniref:membrane bound O-acyl transferase family-domain-containing protein n=1 Tax=Suillus bovinus TaxID=48563 RepID=UPI001B85F309|nr:membrane bound O-acyl transferase family-domain-containing protein [Suillus bovinus]KAG2151598.1 membrane bound O-acyl transferase family-domain-containing protein [Suillus bovinus]